MAITACPASESAEVATIVARTVAIVGIERFCWLSSRRIRWRWLTWAISWASTAASSPSLSVFLIRPVCMPIFPSGPANALMVGLSTTKNSKFFAVISDCVASRSPSVCI